MSFKKWLEDNNKRIDMTGDAWQVIQLADEYAAEREKDAIRGVAEAIINNLQERIKESR